MKRDLYVALHQLVINPNKQDDDDKANGFCRRGLIKHLPDVAQERSEYKLYARNVVLDEQELQADEGSFDPDYIAMIYSEASCEALAVAQAQADRDEWDAWMMS